MNATDFYEPFGYAETRQLYVNTHTHTKSSPLSLYAYTELDVIAHTSNNLGHGQQKTDICGVLQRHLWNIPQVDRFIGNRGLGMKVAISVNLIFGRNFGNIYKSETVLTIIWDCRKYNLGLSDYDTGIPHSLIFYKPTNFCKRQIL